MEKRKTNLPIKKGIKYGVYNHKEGYVETHHRSFNAAVKQASRRKKRMENDFSVCEIYN